MTHTISLTAGQQSLTIRSDTSDVIHWATTYFGPYWKTTPANSNTTHNGPLLTITNGDHHRPATHAHHAVFAREPIGYTHHPDKTVTAHTLAGPPLAFRYNPAQQHLHISSQQAIETTHPGRPTPLAIATTRFAREMLRSQLLADGWALLHASAVVLPDGRALLAVGNSGAGKTTSALTLASAGAGLLANDCCFARPNTAGTLDLLPWPAAAAVGLGLLHALHFTDLARSHLQAGEPPHPTQDQRVTDALLTGRPWALRTTAGRELKAHIWPDQLTRWFGLTLATTGTATRVLLPRTVSSSTTPPRGDDATPTVTDSVFMTADEDRYPDMFGFTAGNSAGTSEACGQVLQRMNRLSRQAIDLRYDEGANRRTLTTLITTRPGLDRGMER
ncbi:hypothetical protein [Streptomyces sp. MMBL 11-1]|uniref:hypothetical protein n=1 Tax=Streptomyces sp. MMBL 11-1 TaxID=3026420 RepID=UPI002362FA15|nr:hypothetical protein [Streptomyces sp. MMBL 11-1]